MCECEKYNEDADADGEKKRRFKEKVYEPYILLSAIEAQAPVPPWNLKSGEELAAFRHTLSPMPTPT